MLRPETLPHRIFRVASLIRFPNPKEKGLGFFIFGVAPGGIGLRNSGMVFA
jgi:hypothetical protein